MDIFTVISSQGQHSFPILIRAIPSMDKGTVIITFCILYKPWSNTSTNRFVSGCHKVWFFPTEQHFAEVIPGKCSLCKAMNAEEKEVVGAPGPKNDRSFTPRYRKGLTSPEEDLIVHRVEKWGRWQVKGTFLWRTSIVGMKTRLINYSCFLPCFSALGAVNRQLNITSQQSLVNNAHTKEYTTHITWPFLIEILPWNYILSF